MTKKYLHFAILFLFSNFLIGYTVITEKVIKEKNQEFNIEEETSIIDVKLDQPINKLIKQSANNVPSGFNIESHAYQIYHNTLPSIKHLIHYLRPNSEPKVFYYEKKKRFSANNTYIIVEFIKLQSDPDPFIYSFKWKKKSYRTLNHLEKSIVNFYNANSKSILEFLYPYKTTKSEPYAIRINGQMHTIVWFHAEIKKVFKNPKPDSFLIVDSKSKGSTIQLLVDENNDVIAKKINGVFTPKKKLK